MLRSLPLCLLALLATATSAQVPTPRPLPAPLPMPSPLPDDVLDKVRPQLDLRAIGADRSYGVYVYDADGVERDVFAGTIPIFDPSRPENGRFTHVSSLGWDRSGRLVIDESRRRGVDAGYVHAASNSFSKFILGGDGQPIGLITLADDRSFVFRLDFDGDGVVDILGVHNAANGRISHVVLDRADTIRRYDEMLAGRTTFCAGASRRPSPTGAGVPFGASALPDARINACEGVGGRPPTPGISTRESLSSSGANVVDQFCNDVLAASGPNPGGSTVAQPPRSTGGPPPPRTGHNVGEAVAEVGADLMDVGRSMSGHTPQAAAVGVPLTILGAALRGIGWLISSASSEPIPGESWGYDWVPFCTNRVRQKASWDLDSIRERIAETDCGDPREAEGPNAPRSPAPLADRNCRQPERFDDFEGLMSRVRGPNCTPDSRAGSQGQCSDAGVPRSGITIDVNFADIAPPSLVKDFEDEVVPRVVNPPRTGQRPRRDN